MGRSTWRDRHGIREAAGGLAHNRSQALAIDRLRRDANYRQRLGLLEASRRRTQMSPTTVCA
jgi:hypothetical protein